MKSMIKQHQKNNFKMVSKKLIIAALLVIGFSSYAQDQSQPEGKSNRGQQGGRMNPEQSSQAQLDKLTTDLKLDAKQQEQIKPIIEEQTAKRKAMMEERMANKDRKKMTAEERQTAMNARKDERAAMENKLKAILTPEQFKKMKDMEQANMDKMREARESREPRDGNGEN
jgi:periplasmic protein CpxP/Spy